MTGIIQGALSQFASRPQTLAEFVDQKVREKTTNRTCPNCGHEHWTMLTGPDTPNDYFLMKTTVEHRLSVPLNTNSDWAMMGYACNNCFFVKWFAIQPWINEWAKQNGTGG